MGFYPCSVLLAPAPHKVTRSWCAACITVQHCKGTAWSCSWGTLDQRKWKVTAFCCTCSIDKGLLLVSGNRKRRTGSGCVPHAAEYYWLSGTASGGRRQPRFSEVSAAVDEAYLEIQNFQIWKFRSSSASVWGRKARGKFISVCDKVIA